MSPPFRAGDRVRLLKTYGNVEAPKAGAVGVVTYRWPDWQVAVKFEGFEQEFAYWPADLEHSP